MSADTPEPNRKPGRRKRKWLRRCLLALAVAILLPPLAYLVLSWAYPFPKELLDAARAKGTASVVLDREGQVLRAFMADNESWMFWVPLEDVSPRLVEATIAVEDQRFYRHPGVDPLAVARAAWTNVARRRVVSGASTLTMQLVRLLRPRRRTLATKAVETFRALQIEGLMDKRQVLEWYLNLAPYGGNLVGAEAAALSYFRKHAADLTLGEAALLAGLPQSPSRLRPDRHPQRAKARRDHVLRRMRACGTITAEQLAVALEEPVRTVREPFPFEAPHFSRMVHRRHRGSRCLQTTLDRRIQAIARTAIREGVDALRGAGITNGAVVVIENETAAVRALVGSCDFHSEVDEGQVNGATAPRSPGSALKPFTYALAFDRGTATPSSVLADVPANYTGYEPRNYDQRYSGPVTAREALAHSLNIPAVALLQQVGQGNVYRLLRRLGLTTLTKDETHYGLALTLGSCEATLLELTNAYAALARLGLWRPYRLLETEALPPGRRLLSRGAAYLVADVLADTSRLGGQALWRPAHALRKMAWKTGTSYGHRDAWSIAYTQDHTVGVWVGNFSGKASRGLVGLRAAAPVAARVLDQIYGVRRSRWFRRPESVGLRTVCATSGLPFGEHCPTPAQGLHICGRSSEEACTVHVQARIDDETGACLCRSCSQGRSYTLRVVERWPVPLAAWLRQVQPHRELEPPHFAGCSRAADDPVRPRILSPTTGDVYVLVEGELGAAQKLLLRAASAADRLYWFVDGALFAAASPSEPAFWPLARGPHTIVCSDSAGRSASAAIEVR